MACFEQMAAQGRDPDGPDRFGHCIAAAGQSSLLGPRHVGGICSDLTLHRPGAVRRHRPDQRNRQVVSDGTRQESKDHCYALNNARGTGWRME